jgi:hypothetical protein
MNSITLKMKIFKRAISIFIISFIAINAKAQVSPKSVLKNWTVLAESGNSIDVSYTIVECESTVKQIHFSVFNESSNDQTIKFKIVVKDNLTQKSFSDNISFDTKKMHIYKASCDSDSILNELKIDLPPTYTADQLTLSISFN